MTRPVGGLFNLPFENRVLNQLCVGKRILRAKVRDGASMGNLYSIHQMPVIRQMIPAASGMIWDSDVSLKVDVDLADTK